MARTFKSRSEVDAHQDCPVCGNSIEVPGYDCAPCQWVFDIPDALLTPDTASKLSAAIARAIEAAAADIARAA